MQNGPVSDTPPRLLRALTALAGAALGVGIFAAGHRLVRRSRPGAAAHAAVVTAARDYHAWAEGPCYRVDGDRIVRVPPPEGPVFRPEAPGASFARERGPGVRRIAVVGESTAEMLERALTALTAGPGCGGRVEVLQCAASGSLPWVAVRRAEEALGYAPDAVVVAIGHNFLLPGPPPPPGPTWAAAGAGSPPPPPGANSQEPLPDPTRDAPELGRVAYRAIVAAARSRGVPVVAVVLASNLWIRPRTGAAYATSPGRAAAWVRWARGDAAGAAAALASTGAEDPLQAWERARFRVASGSWDGVSSDLAQARDLEPGSFRASTATTDAIRDTARASGAALVDVPVLFASMADHGVPGWDVFFDHCHPNPLPLDALGRAVLRASAPAQAAACGAGEGVEEGARRAWEALFRPTGGDGADGAWHRLVDGPSRVFLPPDAAALGWDHAPDDGAWRRLLDGPFAPVWRLPTADAERVALRFDAEVLDRLAATERAAALDALAGSARDGGHEALAVTLLERSLRAAASPGARADLALMHLRMHDETAAAADIAAAASPGPGEGWARAVVGAFAADAALRR